MMVYVNFFVEAVRKFLNKCQLACKWIDFFVPEYRLDAQVYSSHFPLKKKIK